MRTGDDEDQARYLVSLEERIAALEREQTDLVVVPPSVEGVDLSCLPRFWLLGSALTTLEAGATPFTFVDAALNLTLEYADPGVFVGDPPRGTVDDTWALEQGTYLMVATAQVSLASGTVFMFGGPYGTLGGGTSLIRDERSPSDTGMVWCQGSALFSVPSGGFLLQLGIDVDGVGPSSLFPGEGGAGFNSPGAMQTGITGFRICEAGPFLVNRTICC